MEKHCSPYHSVKHASKDGTCYSLSNLRTIAREYNKLVSDDKKIHLNQSKKALYTSLEEAFQDVCSTELCWAKQLEYPSMKNVMAAFRPPKPKEWNQDPRTWLNTYDILDVLKQYEVLYKDFKFLGVFSIDFIETNPETQRCIGDFMCSFRIESVLEEKKKRFALVLNLDKHSGPGIHWMSVYCNLNPKKPNFGIYYYDSVANKTPKEVEKFMNIIKTNVETVFPSKIASKFQVESNKIQKQTKDTECGMFSIVFLTQCLKHIPFDYICQHMKTDDEINKLRDAIYSPFHQQ